MYLLVLIGGDCKAHCQSLASKPNLLRCVQVEFFAKFMYGEGKQEYRVTVTYCIAIQTMYSTVRCTTVCCRWHPQIKHHARCVIQSGMYLALYAVNGCCPTPPCHLRLFLHALTRGGAGVIGVVEKALKSTSKEFLDMSEQSIKRSPHMRMWVGVTSFLPVVVLPPAPADRRFNRSRAFLLGLTRKPAFAAPGLLPCPVDSIRWSSISWSSEDTKSIQWSIQSKDCQHATSLSRFPNASMSARQPLAMRLPSAAEQLCASSKVQTHAPPNRVKEPRKPKCKLQVITVASPPASLMMLLPFFRSDAAAAYITISSMLTAPDSTAATRDCTSTQTKGTKAVAR